MYRLFGNMILIATLVWSNVAYGCAAEMLVDPDPSGGSHARHEMAAAAPCDQAVCEGCTAASASNIIEHKLVGSTKVADADDLQVDGDALGIYDIPALSIPPLASDPQGHQILDSFAATPITRHDTLLE